MLPLMLLGFGMLRGFAITTSLGVLIAIFVTRPAFTAVVEKIMK
jgi:preprotein translocase subunit SecD